MAKTEAMPEINRRHGHAAIPGPTSTEAVSSLITRSDLPGLRGTLVELAGPAEAARRTLAEIERLGRSWG